MSKEVEIMKKFLMALAILCVASPAFAVGPNAGGTLVVHDTGITFSDAGDITPIPPVSAPPANCDAVDAEIPGDVFPHYTIWKVYAAFPDGSSPRLKGLAWGIARTGALYVVTGGLPDPPNCFEITQGTWPGAPGSIGQSFAFTQTAQFVECYWFGGYGYLGDGAIFATVPHATTASMFVDDATPGNTDDIAGYSSIGFGVPGVVVCPTVVPPVGACCYPDGACLMVLQDACVAPGVWYGGDCSAVQCPVVHTGACCLANEVCEVLTPAACAALGGEYKGDDFPCAPVNPCIVIIPTEPTSWGQIKANYR
jgi:hypothetical protein